MDVDPNQIELSSEQRAQLADVSQAVGKAWTVVLSEALTDYQSKEVVKKNGACGETFLQAASQLGLVGCLHGGPADLSSNPIHMEGFGHCDG
jgi:hypothetical protein